MFLRRNILKGLMTRAYKGNGLRVRNDGVGYSVTGARWSVYFIHGDMPKEVMGDLISLVGELPLRGEAYTADKNGNQMEFYCEEDLSAFQMNGTRPLKVTPITVCGKIQVLQDPKDGQIIPMPAAVMSAIDYGEIDGDEELPEGPWGDKVMVESRFYSSACWQNNKMAFAVSDMTIQNERITKLLENLGTLTLWEEDDGQGQAQKN